MHITKRHAVTIGLMVVAISAAAVGQDRPAPPAYEEQPQQQPTYAAPGPGEEAQPAPVAYAEPQRGPCVSAWLGSCLFLPVIFGLWVFSLIAWANIFRRAGYSWAFVFLMAIPLVGLVWFFIFAFRTWPIHRQSQIMNAAQPPPAQPYQR